EVLGEGASLLMVVEEEAPSVSGGGRLATEIFVDTTHRGLKIHRTLVETASPNHSLWEKEDKKGSTLLLLFDGNLRGKEEQPNWPLDPGIGRRLLDSMESSSSCTKDKDFQQMQEERNKMHSKCIAQFKYLETHLRLLNSYHYVDHFNSVIHIYMHEWNHNQFRDTMYKNINQIRNAVVQKDESIISLQVPRTQFELFFKSPNVTCTAYSLLHKDFKESTHYEPVEYRSRLLHYLDELEKLLKERTLKDGELRLKEKAVKAIKEIEKRLVTEGTSSAQKNKYSTSGNDSSDSQPSSDTNTTSKTYKELFESIQSSGCDSNIKELEAILAQQTKDFRDAKIKFSKKTDKFETYFKKLESSNAILERQLARKMDDFKSEKERFVKQIASLESKLASQDLLSNKKEYNELRVSYNALKVKFDTFNRDKGNSHVSKPKVSVPKKVYTGEYSKAFLKKVSQFTTYSLPKDKKFSKKA
nr:SKP1/ASK-interacting protein 16 [Tanacetum cinerariifolium]